MAWQASPCWSYASPSLGLAMARSCQPGPQILVPPPPGGSGQGQASRFSAVAIRPASAPGKPGPESDGEGRDARDSRLKPLRPGRCVSPPIRSLFRSTFALLRLRSFAPSLWVPLRSQGYASPLPAGMASCRGGAGVPASARALPDEVSRFAPRLCHQMSGPGARPRCAQFPPGGASLPRRTGVQPRPGLYRTL